MSDWSFHVRRQRDTTTRAISLVVSRGFGVHVSLTLWWFTVAAHHRDREWERMLREAANDMPEKVA